MTWNSTAQLLTQPATSWWNTPPAPTPPPSASWGSTGLTIFATGIPSAEAFGADTTSLTIAPTGIASAEAFGNAVVKHVLAANQQVRVAVQRASTI